MRVFSSLCTNHVLTCERNLTIFRLVLVCNGINDRAKQHGKSTKSDMIKFDLYMCNFYKSYIYKSSHTLQGVQNEMFTQKGVPWSSLQQVRSNN